VNIVKELKQAKKVGDKEDKKLYCELYNDRAYIVFCWHEASKHSVSI
jgi:hypothetical protein